MKTAVARVQVYSYYANVKEKELFSWCRELMSAVLRKGYRNRVRLKFRNLRRRWIASLLADHL
jgi:hypothetical protein